MTNQHPVMPPLELLQQWWEQADQYQDDPKTYFDYIVTEVVQWGADQELEACCEWVAVRSNAAATELRAGRRPKPPSLKEQALALLDPSNTYGSVTRDEEYRISVTKAEIIRRALEALSND